MDDIDHQAVLKAAMHFSRERHGVVKQMVMSIRIPARKPRVRKAYLKGSRKIKTESPLSRYRKLAQGLEPKKVF